jgi:manganese/zinc/iron transport system permease protein
MKMRQIIPWCVAACLLATASQALADDASSDALWRLLTLRDYNTRVVIAGATVLGIAAGSIGTYMLLRKRALMGDAISHATLPGIAAAFMVMVAMGGSGKNLAGLLLGATVTGVLGVLFVLGLRHLTRLKEDAALGIVLSVFFGAGISLLVIVTKMPAGNAAGLESFIYGKTASMLAADAKLIAAAAAVVCLCCALLHKEFKLLCFDQQYAATQGWPVVLLDVLMMALVVAVTVIGLQAVGLILVIAMLIIPPSAARFWTDRLGVMLLISAGLGGLSGGLGAAISASAPRMPAGAIIVLVAAAMFVISMVFGSARGMLVRAVAHLRLSDKVERQHLLRAMFEFYEQRRGSRAEPIAGAMTFGELLSARSWPTHKLRTLLARAQRRGLVRFTSEGTLCLTEAGLLEATRVTRNHRLWELFLITHADIAASQVDRDADRVEHVLGQEMVDRLEKMLDQRGPAPVVPPSPHA